MSTITSRRQDDLGRAGDRRRTGKANRPAAATPSPETGRLPIILLVSSDRSVLTALENDLDRRFAIDAQIVAAVGAAAGLERVEALAGGTARSPC